jgi:hypothetical protein
VNDNSLSIFLFELNISLAVDDYDARGHHEADAKFSDVDSASGGYPMHSFIAIADAHSSESGSSQHSIPPATDGVTNVNCLEAPVAVSSVDAIALPETCPPSDDAAADSASSFPFVSGGDPSLSDLAASVCSESLISEVQSEGAADDAGSAFAFLSS